MLICSMSVSVDGCIPDREGGFEWTAPSEELQRELGARYALRQSLVDLAAIIQALADELPPPSSS